MLRWCLFISLVIPASFASGETLVVLPDGSGPYSDLHAAITSAADGDTIALGDGLFVGPGNRNLATTDRSLTFRSQSGESNLCVVDLEGLSRFVTFAGGPSDSVVVEDLTFVNGFGNTDGGCIVGSTGNVIVRRCRIADCLCIGYRSGGGAIAQHGGSLRLEHCELQGNHAVGLYYANVEGKGGAVYSRDATVSLLHSTFTNNVATGQVQSTPEGGAVACKNGALVVDDCQFKANNVGNANAFGLGGAVFARDGYTEIYGCVFVGNGSRYTSAGGALAVVNGNVSSDGVLESCTFADNISRIDGGTLYVSFGDVRLAACIIMGTVAYDLESNEMVPAMATATGYQGVFTAADCDVWGNGEDWSGPLAGQHGQSGNFSADPCFCDTVAGDFSLCSDSWCAPDNNLAHPGVLVGALQVGCELCGCTDGPVNVDEEMPRQFLVLGASPNPFNPATVIHFEVPTADVVRLTVHDLAGRHVSTLVDDLCAPGKMTVTWNGTNDRGFPVASGIYCLRLVAGNRVGQSKVALLR
jgi:hypothetical protein